MPERQSITLPKKGPPVRYMSSHQLKLGSLRKNIPENKDSPKKNSTKMVQKVVSSSSVNATLGDFEYGAPDSRLLSLRLKDSSNHLIVDKALFLK